MNNKFTIEAILKASGADQFANDFNNATKSMDGIERSTKKATGGIKSFMGGVGKIAGAIGLTKLVSAGFTAIKSSVDSAVSRVDTLNQFPKVLQQMGATGEEAEWSIERLADGIEGLPTKLDDVAGQAQRMFTILGDVELATESTLALNNAFLASGASSADASRGLEQYMQMLSTGKVDMQSWRTLQDTMPYALKETAEAFGFTGEAATNDFYDALQSGEITMAEMNEKIIELSEGTGGFAETALTATEGIATSWQNLQTAISRNVANVIEAYNDWASNAGFLTISEIIDKMKEAVDRTFGSIIEKVPKALEWFVNLFNTITESTAFQSFKKIIQEVIEIGQELVTSFLQSEAWSNFKDVLSEIAQALLDINFMELLETWSPLIAGILGAVGAFKVIMGVMTFFNTIMGLVSGAVAIGGGVIAFLTSPIGIAVAAIGIIIAIGVSLWKNWETISEKAHEIWGAIADWFSEIWTSIAESASEIWGGITTFFSETWESITETVQTAWEFITNLLEVGWLFIQELFNLYIDLIMIPWNFLWENFGDPLTEAWETIKSYLSATLETISNWITEKWNAIKTVTTTIWNAIKTVLMTVWNTIKTLVSTAVTAISTKVSAVWESIKGVTSSIWNGIKSTISSVWEGIKSGVSTATEAVKTSVSGAWDSVKTKTSEVWSSLKEAITTPINSAKDTVKGAIDKMKGFMNFSWSLPKLKMPHFTKSGKFSLNPPSVPKFGIEWYKDGGIMTSATAFGMNGNNVMVGGEAGREAILPLNRSVLGDIGRGIVAATKTPESRGEVSPQPAYINVNIGGQNFRGFVENISNEQGKITDLDLAF